MRLTRPLAWRALALALTAGLASPACADLVLSQVVVDMLPQAPARVDIEAWNDGSDRMYVTADPAEIVAPGTPGEHRVVDPDPAVLGLLVSPQKMVLEPGQRQLIRIASIVARGPRERVYRVTVKPVAGAISATGTALKILVGYDVLVIVRPTVMTGTVSGQRQGSSLVLHNEGTTNVEMYEGKQCNPAGADCKPLPPRRLYAGASWQQPIDPSRPVEYRIKSGITSEVKRF